ncbi:MAG: hypothetical protein U0353_19940 [Sandaracinus sp.]
MAINNAHLAITADHVPAVQGVVRDMVTGDPVYYAEQYRAFISRNDVTHNGAPYNVLDFNRDLRAGAVPADVCQAVGDIASRAIVESVALQPTDALIGLMQENIRAGMSPREATLALRRCWMQGAIGGYNQYLRAAGYAGNRRQPSAA